MHRFVGPLDFDGPPNFLKIRQRIEEQGRHMLTLEELACLFCYIDNASDIDEHVVNVMKHNFILANTAILWTPARVYVKDNPDSENGKVRMDGVEFDIELEYNVTPSVRFLPTEGLEEHCGAQPHDTLATNPFAVLQANEKGAEQLAQVAAHREQGAYLTFVPERKSKIIALSLGGTSSVQRVFDRVTVGCLDPGARGFGVSAEIDVV